MDERLVAQRLLIGGASALFLLIALTLFVGPHSLASLQKQVADNAEAVLKQGGFTWANASADGQNVLLDGVAPTEAERAAAVAAASGAAGASDVSYEALEVAPVVAPYRLMSKKDRTGVSIVGVAPNRPSLRAIEQAAHAFFGDAAHVELRVASGAPEGVTWDIAAIEGLDALAHLDQGSADLIDHDLLVDGVAQSDIVLTSIREKFARPSNGLKATLGLVGPAEWTARIADGRITFSGKTETQSIRQALIKATGLAISRIDDQTTAGTTGAWQGRAIAALPQFARFTSGEMIAQGDQFRISGVAPGSVRQWLREDMDKVSDAYKVSYDIAEAPPKLDEIAGLDFDSPARRRSDCATAFSRVLKQNPIQFSGRTATLSRTGGEALDKLTEVARRCGRFSLEVQGYTDSAGNRAANVALSRKQAEAVLAWLASHGIAADRLTAMGYGPEHPVGNNRTANGRAANRRIEIRLTGESDG